MKWDVAEVRVAGEYALEVRFRDGLAGAVKFTPTFFRGVFSHLSDHEEFRKVHVVDGVVTWPGELDLAPDAMYAQISQNGEWLVR